MAVKSLHQLFYYYNKYLNNLKCQEISMGPSKCTIHCIINCFFKYRKVHKIQIFYKNFKIYMKSWLLVIIVLDVVDYPPSLYV
jgi:hypothetical protein